MIDPTCGDPQTPNTERALWGMASLTGLVNSTGDNQGVDLTPGADPPAAARLIVDALANLRHYADIDLDDLDRQAEEFYLTENDDPTRQARQIQSAYRRYTAALGDTTQALLHLAHTAGIAVAWMDRTCIEGKRGTALSDEQWARVAPLLQSYHEHVSWGDGNHLYLDQIFAKAGIGDPDDPSDPA